MHEHFLCAVSEFRRLIARDTSDVSKCGHCIVPGSVGYVIHWGGSGHLTGG
jgi:hypothetical protein